MNIAEIRKQAREKLQPFCRVCAVCDGKVCAGEVPGMGGAGTGSSFRANLEALARQRFVMKTIHSIKKADTSFTLWGVEFSMPIFAAPITGISYNMGGKLGEEEFSDIWVGGAAQAGSMGMTGDGADAVMYDGGLKAIQSAGGRGIPFVKPRGQEEIVKRIRQAEEAGAVAVGMDVDGAGLITMALKGQPVGPKTPGELAAVIKSTALPFVVKGIMSPDEAEIAAECGAAAIVVSNHGGRVLDSTPGAADVLQAIAEKVKGNVTIFCDGGVRSGGDVLKLLALGADGILVGRPLVVGAFGGGREGVALLLNRMGNEIVQAMLLTGTSDVRQVDSAILA
ncbi:MAG TPA: alpha-hydroxy-acid oxidizing protein [Dissulfurispiraceae bacterium]|nr:alpha-hydroxy-acid oxidizing protein [Dissulfurispiraceae bacterium]